MWILSSSTTRNVIILNSYRQLWHLKCILWKGRDLCNHTHTCVSTIQLTEKRARKNNTQTNNNIYSCKLDLKTQWESCFTINPYYLSSNNINFMIDKKVCIKETTWNLSKLLFTCSYIHNYNVHVNNSLLKFQVVSYFIFQIPIHTVKNLRILRWDFLRKHFPLKLRIATF